MAWALLRALDDVWERPAGFFFPGNVKSLDFLDMHFFILDVFGRYLRLDEQVAVVNI